MKPTNPKSAPLPGAPPQPASAPIDISKARPKARAAKRSSSTGPAPAANSPSQTGSLNPKGEAQPSFTLRQRRFLQLLREGNNITMAAAILGITRHGYSQWRRRTEGFRAAVAAAREVHRQEVACAFHDADAYARSLLDRVQRDQSLPAALRLRAANHLLRRPGLQDWLPATLPEDLDPDVPSDDSPTELPGFPDFAGEILPLPARASRETNPAGPPPEPESANAAAEPRDEGSTQSANAPAAAQCGNGQSQSATAAHGSLPNQPPAPLAVAQSIQPSALHAYIHQVRSESRNHPPNQQHPTILASPLPASQTGNHAYNAYTLPGAAKPTRGIDPHSPGVPSLSETWLNPAFLHKHEKPKAFESLLNNYMRTYAPATAPEELLVFRIAQKAWLLRRVEIWERVIADSRVTKVREKHPNAAAPACIALALVEAKETGETRFYQRASKFRQEHEDALDRLESRLETLQLRRESATRREERRPFNCQQLAASETAFPSPS